MTHSDERSEEERERPRVLPTRITIPDILGEMVYLRPATSEDLPLMDRLDAYVNASGITGKDRVAERAAVHAWVRRSEAWADGTDVGSGIDDPERRRTIAWALMTTPDDHDDEPVNAHNATEFLGMIFLIDIDGWARSARIQVVLGKDFRGRGYSRDAMPRVMTYGFAEQPEGLGLHRIWVAVPEKNTRTFSVYQSLGFVPSGTSRDALWDNRLGKYQDLNVLDTLVDEFDPVRAMDAFGMHVITTNPGMEKALSLHEHSMAIKKQQLREAGLMKDIDDERKRTAEAAVQQHARTERAPSVGETMRADAERLAGETLDAENAWPYNSSERNTSKKAWWRTLGRDRNRRGTTADDDK
ncbi:GNAT family N-acetyltransferase [Bifidobacterium criceti]|uniref:GNAT family acetyltransferase n=1 Tax=Bifidobacterium criceti TaxID=1960969 RepID=A0A2A2EH25_9BIFI|nr:GNAT family N-acetyltransferase [Bifidobacterium criceti]PAU68544.1 GNAT family acetyltransferase [Bifidobacterium criceti]